MGCQVNEMTLRLVCRNYLNLSRSEGVILKALASFSIVTIDAFLGFLPSRF